MASGIYCDCGVELNLDDPLCKSCGKRKSFKVDPRITDAAWADWYKHLEQNLENDELEKKSATGPVLENKKTSNSKRQPSFSSRREVKEEYRKRNSPAVTNAPRTVTEGATNEGKTTRYLALLSTFAAIALVVLFLSNADFSSFTRTSTGSSGSSSGTNTSITEAADAPSQPTIPESTQVKQLAPGDAWDIYIAYFVDCAISQYDETSQILNCSKNGSTIFPEDRDGKMGDYIVPTWVDSKSTREIVCSNPYELNFDQDEASDIPAVDEYLELQIEQGNGLLVTAGLVSPPSLEEATLSKVIDLDNPSSLFGEWYSEAPTALESDTYAGGFCIAHFRVTEMPAFSSALKISTTKAKIEWTLNPDELQSRNFLILSDQGDNYVLDLWKSKDFSSRVK